MLAVFWMTLPSTPYSHACSAQCAIIAVPTCIMADWPRPFEDSIPSPTVADSSPYRTQAITLPNFRKPFTRRGNGRPQWKP
jgi:hypothetical protein